MNSGSSILKNMDTVKKFIIKASNSGSSLIVFPENCFYRGPASGYYNAAHDIKNEVIPELVKIASKFDITIVCGSIIENSRAKDFYYNTSIVIDNAGDIIGKYRKIHLFDTRTKGIVCRESKHFMPGRSVEVISIGKIKLGLAICFDIRFPEQFLKMALSGALVIAVPSDFTNRTGVFHWKPLVTARAIENQVFMLCPNQWGINPLTGKPSYGNSLIADPWGRTLNRATRTGNRLLTADLDIDILEKIRMDMQCLKHRHI